jgi:hypothetical protein
VSEQKGALDGGEDALPSIFHPEVPYLLVVCMFVSSGRVDAS